MHYQNENIMAFDENSRNQMLRQNQEIDQDAIHNPFLEYEQYQTELNGQLLNKQTARTNQQMFPSFVNNKFPHLNIGEMPFVSECDD